MTRCKFVTQHTTFTDPALTLRLPTRPTAFIDFHHSQSTFSHQNERCSLCSEAHLLGTKVTGLRYIARTISWKLLRIW